jgi:ABC-type transport system involved in multi-copper enzyme maturation permease subunit
LFIGPVFTREATIAPRRARTYIGRAACVLALLVLLGTGWLVLTGTQLVEDIGDLARFGTMMFQILAPLQLALAVFFAALLAASEVAHEKDRHTLVLLLATSLSNSELVLGKLLASLLGVLTMLLAAFPVFMLTALFGGISYAQIGRVMAVTLASVLVAGSLGSTLALWREKTFQALAMTALALVLWLVVGEAVAAGVLGDPIAGLSAKALAAGVSPWQAIQEAVRAYSHGYSALGPLGSPIHLYVVVALALTVLLNGVAIAMVRVWNPSREAAAPPPEQGTDTRRPGDTEPRGAEPHTPAPLPYRRAWDNPVIWREMRTWAYGRKILVVRLAYLALFAAAAAALWASPSGDLPARATLIVVPLALLSLVLVNAQAVTALTSERDIGALDLLLVTDLTPPEIVYGKLGGVFYNAKEMVILPMLLCVGLWLAGSLGLENLLFLLGGMAVLYVFAATLGLHAGMTYVNSGAAVATSLGTVFFLFLGVALCMRIMLAFSGSFSAQFLPFFAFMVFGGVGLYAVLGVRNPSSAIGLASFLCPFATFYAITSYLIEPPSPLAVFLVSVAAYGFTTAAMLVPALSEFDVATGRASAE